MMTMEANADFKQRYKLFRKDIFANSEDIYDYILFKKNECNLLPSAKKTLIKYKQHEDGCDKCKLTMEVDNIKRQILEDKIIKSYWRDCKGCQKRYKKYNRRNKPLNKEDYKNVRIKIKSDNLVSYNLLKDTFFEFSKLKRISKQTPNLSLLNRVFLLYSFVCYEIGNNPKDFREYLKTSNKCTARKIICDYRKLMKAYLDKELKFDNGIVRIDCYNLKNLIEEDADSATKFESFDKIKFYVIDIQDGVSLVTDDLHKASKVVPEDSKCRFRTYSKFVHKKCKKVELQNKNFKDTANTTMIAKKFKKWLLDTNKTTHVRNNFNELAIEFSFRYNNPSISSTSEKRALFFEMFDESILWNTKYGSGPQKYED
jgi:hypothetical protein